MSKLFLKGTDGKTYVIEENPPPASVNNEAVLYTEQTLTEAQKAQARENIGITGTGRDGIDGYTPVAGVDYYTETDKAEFSEYIASELAKRGQLKPEFANSIEECTDETKLYVLPDGYIYGYILTKAESVPLFTNMIECAEITTGHRYSLSGKAFKELTGCDAVVFQIPSSGSITIRLHDCSRHLSYMQIYGGTSSTEFTTSFVDNASGWATDSNGDQYATFTNSAGCTYVVVMMETVDVSKAIITVNEEIKWSEVGTLPNFTNLMDDAGAYVKDGYRYSHSGAAFTEYAAGTTLVFPYKASAGTHVFRIRGGVVSQDYSAGFYLGDDNQSFPHTRNSTVVTDSNGDIVYTTTSSTDINGYLSICIEGVTDVNNIIVTLNEEITYTTIEGGMQYQWANTGHAFVPADYEDRIIDIETDIAAHDRKIAEIETRVENIGVDESETAAYTRMRNWQYPIYENAPVFLLSENKPALTSSDMTTAAIYAKYDALMAANPHYISRVNCGMASDGTTPIYAYHFRQPNPHYLHKGSTQWTEKKPTFLVCSGVHPREQTGINSMFYALEEITTNPELFDIKRNLHIIVFPMLNPTAFEDDQYHMRNPDGIQVHHNFEVAHGINGAVQGDRYYGGATPLSIPETQYFDAMMEEYKDSLVCVLSCHNNELDERHGTGVIWCSCATHFTCNLGFRFADKMSIAWREKHGAEVFDAGIRWANDFVLAQYENPTISAFEWMFDIITPERQEDWDYLIGRSNMSGSGGTEYRQGTKYGIHGVNVETCPRCMILDRDFNATNTSNVMTMGTETYINYFRTFMAAYSTIDKKDYAPNLPWTE